jgi:hypothetical protein
VLLLRKLLIGVALAAIGVSLVASAATGRSQQQSVTSSLLLPGVTYTREVDFTSRGPIVLDVVTAPKPDGKVYSLAPALSNNQLRGKESLTRLEKRVAGNATTTSTTPPARRAGSTCRTACSTARPQAGVRASALPLTARSRPIALPSPESGRGTVSAARCR